ncbi:MAG: hypothetical protein LBR85_05715 [Oscillospiraceae bacterium]|jgi:chemotaxis protein MotB|nr:hypothetical protein [Oscillospiraceae bacterium]
MAREKKEQAAPTGASCPAWLATYGDMVTLVLTFFVLLFAFSTLDAAKWQQIVEGLRGETPTLIAESQPLNIPNPPSIVQKPSADPGTEASDQAWQELFDNILKFFESQEATNPPGGNDGDLADLEYAATHITIELPSRFLFDSARFNLKDDAVDLMAALVDEIRPQMGMLRGVTIEGHTDTDPVGAGAIYRDNFELSFRRGNTVRDAFLVSLPDIPASFYDVQAKGEDFPKVDAGEEYEGDLLDGDERREWVMSHNTTEEQKAQNRRCVIILNRNPNAEVE